MSIEHTCPSCQMRLRVADESAGKKVRCKCGAISAVPAATAPPSKPAVSAAASGAPPAAAAGASPSIAVTCSNCQQTLRAPQSAAGKAVRCKCGQVVPVPAAKGAAAVSKPAVPAARTPARPSATAASIPAAASTAVATPAARPATAPRQGAPVARAVAAAPVGAMARPAAPGASIFDELTEADWNRESPIKRAYAPPAASKDGAVLKQFVGKDMAPTRKQSGSIPGGLIALSVLNFLAGGVYVVVAIGIIVLAQAASYAEKLQDILPALHLGALIACVYFVFWGIFDLVLAVGLLQRGAWGWCVAAVGYAMSPILAIYQVAMKVMDVANGANPGRIVGMFFGVGITIAITAYVFKDDTRRHFGVKTATPVIVCAILGVLLGLATIGVLVLLNMTSESMIPANANAG